MRLAIKVPKLIELLVCQIKHVKQTKTFVYVSIL